MAARITRTTNSEEIRSRIKIGQLLNALEKQALDLKTDELSPTRVKAIEILLRKALPDLSAVTHSSDPNKPFVFITRAE